MRRFMIFMCSTIALIQIPASGKNISDVNIFGYSQTTLRFSKDVGDASTKWSSSASVQELDVFFQKTFSSFVSTLIDLQFTGNYSTSKNWGNLALDQAWVKFSFSRLLNIRVGKMLPTFNSFNEVKTRFPMFPYITRPIAYETSFQEALYLNQWIPEHVMMQVNGTARFNFIKADYAVFLGNSEFISNKTTKGSLIVNGTDTTNFKLVGGRIGVRTSGIKFGVSGTYDYTRSDFINNTVNETNATLAQLKAAGVVPNQVPDVPVLREHPRMRIGFDLSYTGYGLTIAGEYVLVKEFLEDKDEETLKTISHGTAIPAGVFGPDPVTQLGTDLDKDFWNVTVTYDFLDKYYVAVGICSDKDNANLLIEKNGVVGLSAYFGYRLTDNVTLKSEFTQIRNDVFGDDAVITLKEYLPQFAISLLF